MAVRELVLIEEPRACLENREYPEEICDRSLLRLPSADRSDVRLLDTSP